MKKKLELTDPTSCMSRALDEEMTFVLLARDLCAPATIRFWANERVRNGKNHIDDFQIQEALNCAAAMEKQYDLRQRAIRAATQPLLDDNARITRGAR